MTYDIRFHAKLEDDLAAIPLATRTHILSAACSLADNPRPPGAKKLSDIKRKIENVYRIHVGSYRICYQIFNRKLLVSVIAAAERGTIYQLLKRRLKQ